MMKNAYTSRTSGPIRYLLKIICCILFVCIFQGRSEAFNTIMTYRINSIDERFGLSRQEVTDAVHEAVAMWEKAIGHTIFQEDPAGSIEIDLVYDNRQAVTDKLKNISRGIDDAKASYDELMSLYNDLKAEVERKNAAYSAQYDAYMRHLNAYSAELDAVNKNDTFSNETSQRLSRQKQSLNAELEGLQAQQADLQKTVDDLNGIVANIGSIASNHNSQVMSYKNMCNELTGNFASGRYERTMFRESITIFEFSGRNMLVRTLAHEFGHAQGLEHSKNPGSIMYYRINSDCKGLAPEDIAAMQARCGNNLKPTDSR
ncbi:MAG: matrixin family metalloprotease [Desulfomonilia bacterium]